jgi:hypothetical protein
MPDSKIIYIIIIVLLIGSGLAFSQQETTCKKVFSYIGSLYIPYQSSNSKFAMNFGKELSPAAGEKLHEPGIHQRNFVK